MKDQKHMSAPRAESSQLQEKVRDFLVAHRLKIRENELTIYDLSRKLVNRLRLGPREANANKSLTPDAHHCVWRELATTKKIDSLE
jgi:hypothetical protein